MSGGSKGPRVIPIRGPRTFNDVTLARMQANP